MGRSSREWPELGGGWQSEWRQGRTAHHRGLRSHKLGGGEVGWLRARTKGIHAVVLTTEAIQQVLRREGDGEGGRGRAGSVALPGRVRRCGARFGALIEGWWRWRWGRARHEVRVW